jgi:hypothetical protein
MSVDGHFKGRGANEIHTSKAGTCGKGSGTCDYKKNTKVADGQTKKMRGWEAHHVVCVQIVIRYQELFRGDEDKRNAIDGVYRGTDWCINQSPNMQWMPQKETYVAHGNDDYTGAWTLNLPCHDWDHTSKGGYFDELLKAIETRIWSRIKAVKQSGDKKHFTPEKAKAALKNLASDYKRKLHQRGTRKGGTANAIKNKNAQWWFPFSMANAAVASATGPRAWVVPRASPRSPATIRSRTRS